MNSPISARGQRFTDVPKSIDMNINGEVRDQDTFVLGDDDDEEENKEEKSEILGGDGAGSASISSPPPPPFYESIVDPWKEELPPNEPTTPTLDSNPLAEEPSPKPVESDNTRPHKYYLNRSDTLQGLSLRFGIDSHEICKLNKLSPSAIRMTPHLLHTRVFLILPPTAKPHSSLKLSSAEEKAREEKLTGVSQRLM